MNRLSSISLSVQSALVAALLASALSASGCGSSSEDGTGNGATAAEQAAKNPRAIDFETSYAKGLERARKEGKPLLLLFTFDGCTYCRELKSTVLTDPNVVRISREFVCAEVNLDREGAVCKSFRVRGYPTVLMTEPEGQDLSRLTGVKRAAVLTVEMESALRTRAQYLATGRRNPAAR